MELIQLNCGALFVKQNAQLTFSKKGKPQKWI